MTYNFDPERWLEDEQARIGVRQRAGELTTGEAAAALEEAERRYEGMLERLDGTFQLRKRDAEAPEVPCPRKRTPGDKTSHDDVP